MLSRLLDPLTSLVYPQECRVCHEIVDSRDDGVACASCWNDTRLLSGNEMLCTRCGAYLGEKAAPISVHCRKCDDHVYEKAIACGIYEKALAASILALKESPRISRRLTTVVEGGLARIHPNADLVIPIPLAKRRQIERGFNQAELIAQLASKFMQIPMDVGSLARKVHTPLHRIGMDQKARELSVKNAFEVVRPKLINGKSVLLVDDVLTSGSTASYCAKALKKRGATSVKVFTLARAVMRY